MLGTPRHVPVRLAHEVHERLIGRASLRPWLCLLFWFLRLCRRGRSCSAVRRTNMQFPEGWPPCRCSLPNDGECFSCRSTARFDNRGLSSTRGRPCRCNERDRGPAQEQVLEVDKDHPTAMLKFRFRRNSVFRDYAVKLCLVVLGCVTANTAVVVGD